MKKITDLFIKLASTTRCSEDNSELEVTRIGGALRFRETDSITNELLVDYYIGEIDTCHGFRFVMIEKRGARARTRYVGKKLEEALAFFNETVCKNGVRYSVFTMADLAQIS